MSYTLREVADIVGGQLLDPEAGDVRIAAALPYHAAHPQSITFLSQDRKIDPETPTQAGGVFVNRGRGSAGPPTIEVDHPLEATLRIAALLQPAVAGPPVGIHPTAVVDPSAQVDPTACIGPYVVVEANVTVGPRSVVHSHSVLRAWSVLGEDVVLHPHVVLYPFTQVGARTVLHSGVVLGSDGFGYQPNFPVHTKVPQLGNVEVSTDVEIGANSTVDRATLGSTTIGMSTKIDNQVQIAHNCQIGPRNIFAAHVGISGSCKTGDMVWMAGKVGLADHVSIGDGALLMAMAGVGSDIAGGERLIGAPARPVRQFFAEHVALSKLPGLLRELRDIRKKVDDLANNQGRPDDRKCA